MQTMWHIINSETNKNSSKIKQNITLKINNNNLTNPKMIANTFNKFFAQVCKTNSLHLTPTQIFEQITVHNQIENTLYLQPVQPQEIYSIIMKLKK